MSHELDRLRAAHEQVAPPDPELLDEIRQRLLAAAEREAARERRTVVTGTGRVRQPMLVPAAHRRRRRRARRLAVVGALAVAGAVVAVVVPSNVTGPPTDAIAKARAALAAPGEIVHYTLSIDGVKDSSECETGPMQIWRAAEPTRWRLVQPVPDPDRCGSIDLETGGPIVGPRVEVAYHDGRTRTYVPGRNLLQVIVDDKPAEGERRAPSSASNAAALQTLGSIVAKRRNLEQAPAIAGVPDPVTGVEELLAEGELRDTGVRDRDGRRVRVLAGGWERPGGIERTTIEYVVDAETFAPIAMSARSHVRGGETATVRATFGDYERIPLTDESSRLLEIHPDGQPREKRTTIDEIKGR
jgi:hypothetical protein